MGESVRISSGGAQSANSFEIHYERLFQNLLATGVFLWILNGVNKFAS